MSLDPPSLENFAPDVRRALEFKVAPSTREAFLERLVATLARDVETQSSVLFASDFDGTMGPFANDPLRPRADPLVAAAYSGFQSLPNVAMRVITGGDAQRSAHVLSESGLRIDAYCVYGSQQLRWDGQEAHISLHPRIAQVEASMSKVLFHVDNHLRQRMGVPDDQPVTSVKGDVAEAQSLVLLEKKGNIYAFHPKGTTTYPSQVEWVGEAVARAVEAVQSEAKATAAMLRCNRTRDVSEQQALELADETLRSLVIHENSGNYEVVFDLGLSKATVFAELVAELQPRTVIFNVDDRGDLPGLDALEALRNAGEHNVFTAAVCNPPVERAGRVGSPLEIVERVDVAFLTAAEMGAFYSSALGLAASRYPASEALSRAARVNAHLSAAIPGPQL